MKKSVLAILWRCSNISNSEERHQFCPCTKESWWNEEYPEFSNNLKCHKFTIKSKDDGYEERCYDESTWAAASIQAPHDKTRILAFQPLYQTLFKYINGKNDQKVKIPMIAPVLVSMKKLPNKNDTLEIKMHFFIPPTILMIPKPTNNAVKFVSYPKLCVYVRVFGGYQMEVDRILEVQRNILTDALDKAGRKYQEVCLVYAGYDSPLKLFHRHNEIMLGVESEDTDKLNIFPNEISPQIQLNDVD
ncbi:heme-binding protein 1-like [Hydra vulgaris]|uniref:Heme-binding protein 1-like n=1 Tax=Hydra vulgaris TaxID=6087 RepID=A0ABM4CRK2_HYDVU